MKVPEGKTVYVGGKKLKAGDEIPDGIAKNLEEKKPLKKPKPSGDDKPTAKP